MQVLLSLILAVLLGLPFEEALGGVGSAHPIKAIRTPRVPGAFPDRSGPSRDDPTRILVIRVEFATDTVSTTSGAGKFAYERTDSLYAAFDDTVTIYFDPPPHDSLFFADHLTFLQFYYDKMSAGRVELEWDIFPAGMQAAYQLPRQMWQYNWNQSDTTLDRQLAELFRDAIRVADEDPAVIWDDYDLVMIFHAGAGSEFDLGFSSTPHDIPSAWMVVEDFDVIGLSGGIPVDNGDPIEGGLILPETESHEGVQIGMAGVIVSLFGHWLGLPALYDKDDGNPVVGKWSLMDRGFGNYFGAIPGLVDAWSRSYMEWLDLYAIPPGDYAISALGFASVDAPEAFRIPIDNNEYFILENRSRDPENNSLAIGYDRDGRRIVFTERYDSVLVDPGFKVPVRIDNLDFDAPGSGILIWHVEGILTQEIDRVGINSIDDHRGLDLEEADGAQDIGQNYPLLTPGYGTDYGIYTDAWYFDNTHHQDANGGRQVAFNNNSYPASMSNSGALTHISIGDFSRRDTVMSFRFGNDVWQFPEPVPHPSSSRFVIGNFDDDIEDDEFIMFGNTYDDVDYALVYDGNCLILDTLHYGDKLSFSQMFDPIVRNLDADPMDEVVFAVWHKDNVELKLIDPMPDGLFQLEVKDIFQPDRNNMRSFACLGGETDNPILFMIQRVSAESIIRTYNPSFDRLHEASFTGAVYSIHRLGSAVSDSVLITCTDFSVYMWDGQQLSRLGKIFSDPPQMRYHESGSPFLVDIDGNGLQDLAVYYSDTEGVPEGDGQRTSYGPMIVWYDVALGNVDDIMELFPWSSSIPRNLIFLDVDRDGLYEIVGITGSPLESRSRLVAREINGSTVAGFPTNEFHGGVIGAITDLNGDDAWEFIVQTRTTINVTYNGVGSWLPGNSDIEIKTSSGQNLFRTPVSMRMFRGSPYICQLDDDPNLELLLISSQAVDALEIPNPAGTIPRIWWAKANRDYDNSNAIWEPPTTYSAPPGSRLMPLDLCYNWPNPASQSTAIRYTLYYPGSVKVDIFDIVGERVTTLHGMGEAGMPGEIVWDLSGVGRGGYVAVVEARGNGRTESKIVKIAVVK